MPEFTELTERQPITMLTKGCPTVINPRACQRLYENHFFFSNISYVISIHFTSLQTISLRSVVVLMPQLHKGSQCGGMI